MWNKFKSTYEAKGVLNQPYYEKDHENNKGISIWLHFETHFGFTAVKVTLHSDFSSVINMPALRLVLFIKLNKILSALILDVKLPF